MGWYSVDIEKRARKELAELHRSGNKADIKRIEAIFEELKEYPETGIGNLERLKYKLSGFWSRRINSKDRLVYRINDTTVIVTVISAKGHYEQ